MALVLLAAPAMAGASAIADQPGTTPSSTALTVEVANPSGPAATPVVGDLATFGVLVTDASGTALTNPTGAVDVYLGSATGPEVCEATLSANSGSSPLSSSGSCQAPVAGAGIDAYFAQYQGDPTFSISQGSQELAGVDSATTTSVSANGTGIIVGTMLAASADVLASSPGAATAPTGTVTFLDDGTPVDSCVGVALTAGAGAADPSTAPCDFLVTRTDNAVTATYSGDTSDGPSTSAPAVVVAEAATPTLSLSASDADPVAGETLTIDATLTGVSGVAPTQSIGVEAQVGGGRPQLLSDCSDQSFPALGTASCTYPVTSTEPLAFQASYSGDAGYAPASATPLDLTPGAATPTVGISTSETKPMAGGSDSVTAIVTGNALVGAPTGAITVLQGSTMLGTCGSPVTVGDTESVICPVNYPGAGDVVFTASVAADANYATASATATRNVAHAAPNVTVAAPTAAVGSTVQATALVTGSADITPGPSGAIEVFANGSYLRNCTLTQPSSISEQLSCPYTYESTAPVTFSSTVLVDANYASAIAVPVVETATQATTATALTSYTATPTIGGLIELKATVTGPKNAVLVTGRVEFLQSTGAGHPYTVITTCGSDGQVGLDLSGVAQCSDPLATTTTTFSATYGGDSNYLHSSSPVYKPTISRAAAAIVVARLASGSAPVPGTFVHIQAILNGDKAAGAPTGTLSIKGPAGSKCATSCTGNTLQHVSGDESQATFAMSFAAAGLAKVTVTYGGSAVYLPGTGSTQFTIDKPPKTAPRQGASQARIRTPLGSPRLLFSSGSSPRAVTSRRSAAGLADRSIAISRRSWSHA
jgi:hypothetical protein